MSLMINTERYNGNVKTAKEAIEQCVLANRVLANEKVVDAYGHISIRNPENPQTFFISRATSPEFVTKDDILEIDFEGNVITKTDKKPYGERILHAAVYKVRPDVNSISHAHCHSIIPFTCTDVPFGVVLHSSAMFYEGVPVYGDFDIISGMHIVTREEGDRMARALKDKRGLLLRNHGVVVVGESIPHTVMASIFIRDNASILVQAMAIGKPHFLGYEEARKCAELMFGQTGLERGWNYWVTKAKEAFPDIRQI